MSDWQGTYCFPELVVELVVSHNDKSWSLPGGAQRLACELGNPELLTSRSDKGMLFVIQLGLNSSQFHMGLVIFLVLVQNFYFRVFQLLAHWSPSWDKIHYARVLGLSTC